ncbi:2-succinyl-5-enolpyruvyl-6-hydroxy-3-cyclohexene-1-carboxylate synthase [Frankliniella fusca]|uniref:2-succinyl-5-enolpyruvyl-6-hydroxy-3-cyclohexene-1-carboxylate synthase n=1 Tax=Frankliniella fusca TaxID=407009 RepID=A0AAE1GTY5_9NEOP|nr:2-succinyl-5-enolpyruvyl-6-hydroxy-3-cyclohexene-1-carboxylate synthase [Frankliniella fusca]
MPRMSRRRRIGKLSKSHGKHLKPKVSRVDNGVPNCDSEQHIVCLSDEDESINPTGTEIQNPVAVAETESQNEIQTHDNDINPETVLVVEPSVSTAIDGPVCHVEVPTAALITTGVRKLQCLLPADWICVADPTGFSICFLNLGNIKTIQRQIFVSFTGEAKAFVHCRPCPLLDEVFSFVHNPVRFCRDSIDDFCKSVLSLVEIVLQYRVCIGVNSKKYRDKWSGVPKSYIDLNPYLETSYEKTLRSSKCSKLIANDSVEPRCEPCSKLAKQVKKDTSKDAPPPPLPQSS